MSYKRQRPSKLFCGGVAPPFIRIFKLPTCPQSFAVTLSKFIIVTKKLRRFYPWVTSPYVSFFLPPGLSRGTTWHADAVLDKADDSWTKFILPIRRLL
jgi:hypothetical protein